MAKTMVCVVLLWGGEGSRGGGKVEEKFWYSCSPLSTTGRRTGIPAMVWWVVSLQGGVITYQIYEKGPQNVPGNCKTLWLL